MKIKNVEKHQNDTYMFRTLEFIRYTNVLGGSRVHTLWGHYKCDRNCNDYGLNGDRWWGILWCYYYSYFAGSFMFIEQVR